MKKVVSAVSPTPDSFISSTGYFPAGSGNLRQSCSSHRDSAPLCFLYLLPVKPDGELIADLGDGKTKVTGLLDDQISAPSFGGHINLLECDIFP